MVPLSSNKATKLMLVFFNRRRDYSAQNHSPRGFILWKMLLAMHWLLSTTLQSSCQWSSLDFSAGPISAAAFPFITLEDQSQFTDSTNSLEEFVASSKLIVALQSQVLYGWVQPNKKKKSLGKERTSVYYDGFYVAMEGFIQPRCFFARLDFVVM